MQKNNTADTPSETAGVDMMNKQLMPDPGYAFSLKGNVALITGGGSGLGLAMAQCMAACGAHVVIIGRREETLVNACHTIGDSADYRVHDVTRFDEASLLIESIRKKHGTLDILVNNAGLHLKKPATETTPLQFREIMDTHVIAAHALVQAALPGMIEACSGSILFTASMSSFIGLPYLIAYSAAKSAYLGMVRSLASEVSVNGIRVNAIAPGWIETPMLRQALDSDEARKQKILSRTPMQKFGDPMDIGWAAAFLCSPAARFITGTVLPVDGGGAIGF